jgi:hypothetical protein
LLASIAKLENSLRFTFNDREVSSLQLLQIVVANEGEHSIRSFIEPPTLELPEGVEVLDASVIHREPKTLLAEVKTKSANGSEEVVFDFALLNKGELFIAKLLLSGRFTHHQPLTLRMQGDDLPRSFNFKIREPVRSERRWWKQDGCFVRTWCSGGLLVFGLGYTLYFVHSIRPDFFPYPWHSFSLSLAGTAFLASLPLVLALVVVAGIVLGVVSGELFSRRPGFRLPKGFGGEHFRSYVVRGGGPYAYEFMGESEDEAEQKPSTSGPCPNAE